jgi:hypothetical protein
VRRRTAAIVVLVVAPLLLVTCGGSSDEPLTRSQYEQQLQTTMDDLEAAYGDAGAATTGGGGAKGGRRSVAQIVDELRTSQVALRDAGNRLDEITPPEDLAATHDQLVAGVRDMADAVDLLIKAQEAAEQDPAQAKQYARQFGADDSFERVQAAAAKLADAGVDAGL